LNSSFKDFFDCIDTIEISYEQMLAYAARGADNELLASGESIRDLLVLLANALDSLEFFTKMEIEKHEILSKEGFSDFFGIFYRDAQKAKFAVDMVLSSKTISSQFVDNLNASYHLRTLLTSLFLVNDAVQATIRDAGD